MKSSLSFTFTTLLPLLAAAQPIASSAVSLAVNLPGSPLNNQPVVANGGKFWIGKPTSQYCPDNVEKLGGCPKGKDTSIWVNSEQGTGSLVSEEFIVLLQVDTPRHSSISSDLFIAY